MAINKNHEFEELDGVKCGIVERNVAPGRVDFLKQLLEYNGYTVVVVPSPPPKAAAAPVQKVADAGETGFSAACGCSSRNFHCWRDGLYVQPNKCHFREAVTYPRRACSDPGLLAAERIYQSR
jgi:hypothetical protein